MNRINGLFKIRKISLMRLIAGVVLGVLGICAVILLIFSKMSLHNLLEQEIENRQALLQLNVENVNATLDALQGYLYQHFSNSEEITMLETGTDETALFMAKQSLTRNLQKIVGWNEALKFLFFYSPDSLDHVTIQVSNHETDFVERKNLEKEIKGYIDKKLEAGTVPGKGYLLLKEKNSGYVIRFYKIRNSYLGMCLDSQTVLEPLEELKSREGCLAFLSDTEGRIISHTDGVDEFIDIKNNGKILKEKNGQYLQLNYLSKEGDFYIGTWTEAGMITNQFKWMRNLIVFFVLCILAIMAALSLVIRNSLYQPIRDMEKAMKQVGDGKWNLELEDKGVIAEYSSMLSSFNSMMKQVHDLKIENYEKELSAQKSYFQCLQLQVNPHFYLNALNIIYSLAEVKDYKMIQEMTMSLVDYSRYMFRTPEKMVAVSEEIEYVDNYMKIQNLRFPDKIDYQVSISSEIEDAMIPPFVIQSFVENSVKYAMNLERHNVLVITGKLKEIGGELYVELEIRDNGTGYSPEVLAVADETKPADDRYNIGIRNVRQRMEFLFGEKAKMSLKNDNGAVAVLLLPLIWEEDMNNERI